MQKDLSGPCPLILFLAQYVTAPSMELRWQTSAHSSQGPWACRRGRPHASGLSLSAQACRPGTCLSAMVDSEYEAAGGRLERDRCGLFAGGFFIKDSRATACSSKMVVSAKQNLHMQERVGNGDVFQCSCYDEHMLEATDSPTSQPADSMRARRSG